MAALCDIARIVAEAADEDELVRAGGRHASGLQSMRAKIKHLKAPRKDQTVTLRKDLQIAHANFHGAVCEDDLMRLENPGECAAETSSVWAWLAIYTTWCTSSGVFITERHGRF